MRRTLLLIPLLALALTGCAGPPDAPGVAATAGADDRFDPTRLAKCVRENGVPNFPDPEVDGDHIAIRMPDGVRKETADKAMEACKQFQPNGGQPGQADPAVTARLRELAKCMRANGVLDFPDPSADGGIELRHDKNGGGIDPESAAFKKAEESCRQFKPSPPAGRGNS
jgi:hypothetical protein